MWEGVQIALAILLPIYTFALLRIVWRVRFHPEKVRFDLENR